MKISKNGLNMIKKFEGCKLTSYICAGGVPTIGFGHTNGVRLGQTISMKKAEEYLKEDLVKFENGVENCVKVPMSQNMFDALVSFAFNVGNGALKTSTLLKKLNSKDYEGASEEFLKWNKAGGKVLTGLVNRRKEERKLFRKGMKKFVKNLTQKNEEFPSLKGYTGYSIVDGLKKFGYDSSFNARSKYWKLCGKTSKYKGTASQNTELLEMLKK